eukprot:TRINITY_DN6471_c0_g1_i1.p1 TRINITY_DN6471_c0_g1~~TRINITY_DN6471_c0_g1_i1.p1  ORF type:complete len:1207 (+),score=303.00 TRINITY_DN6471_c0_g1_i1:71-3691(+)
MSTSKVLQLTSLSLISDYLARPTYQPISISLFNQRLSEGHVVQLCTAIRNIQGLVALDLGSNSLGDRAVGMICEALATIAAPISTINLGGNSITDGGAVSFAQFLLNCPTIVSINLRFNSIGSKGITEICRAMTRHNSLTSLNLAANRIGPDGGIALANALSRNGTLTSLDLFGNELEDLGAVPLCQALAQSPSITSLNLWCNFVGPRTAEAIADMLMYGARLRELQLGSNQLGNAGMRALVRGVQKAQYLTGIDLADNDISDEGALMFASNVLLNNTSLTSLVLRNNHIHRGGALALADSVKNHPRLRVLNLGANDVTRADCDAVATVLQRNLLLTQLVIFSRTGPQTTIPKLDVDNKLRSTASANAQQMITPQQLYATYPLPYVPSPVFQGDHSAPQYFTPGAYAGEDLQRNPINYASYNGSAAVHGYTRTPTSDRPNVGGYQQPSVTSPPRITSPPATSRGTSPQSHLSQGHQSQFSQGHQSQLSQGQKSPHSQMSPQQKVITSPVSSSRVMSPPALPQPSVPVDLILQEFRADKFAQELDAVSQQLGAVILPSAMPFEDTSTPSLASRVPANYSGTAAQLDAKLMQQQIAAESSAEDALLAHQLRQQRLAQLRDQKVSGTEPIAMRRPSAGDAQQEPSQDASSALLAAAPEQVGPVDEDGDLSLPPASADMPGSESKHASLTTPLSDSLAQPPVPQGAELTAPPLPAQPPQHQSPAPSAKQPLPLPPSPVPGRQSPVPAADPSSARGTSTPSPRPGTPTRRFSFIGATTHVGEKEVTVNPLRRAGSVLSGRITPTASGRMTPVGAMSPPSPVVEAQPPLQQQQEPSVLQLPPSPQPQQQQQHAAATQSPSVPQYQPSQTQRAQTPPLPPGDRPDSPVRSAERLTVSIPPSSAVDPRRVSNTPNTPYMDAMRAMTPSESQAPSPQLSPQISPQPSPRDPRSVSHVSGATTASDDYQLPDSKKGLYGTMHRNLSRRGSMSPFTAENPLSRSASSQVLTAVKKGSSEYPGRTILPGKRKKEDIVFTVSANKIDIALKKTFGKNIFQYSLKIVPGIEVRLDAVHPRGFSIHTPEHNEPLFYTSKQRDALIGTIVHYVDTVNSAEDDAYDNASQSGHSSAYGEDVDIDLSEATAPPGPPPADSPPQQALPPYRVLFAYHATDERMLTIEGGEIVYVLGEEGGWFVAENSRGETGYIPPDYVEPIVME